MLMEIVHPVLPRSRAAGFERQQAAAVRVSDGSGGAVRWRRCGEVLRRASGPRTQRDCAIPVPAPASHDLAGLQPSRILSIGKPHPLGGAEGLRPVGALDAAAW